MRPAHITVVSLALVAVLGGCRGRTPVRADTAMASPSRGGSGPLAGMWRGSDGTLTVTLTLTQAGDSIGGAGSYTRGAGSVGCGGETLPPRGTVTLSGQVAAPDFQARMRFDNGWSPPYLGTVAGADTLRGHFMSVDRGGCTLVLVRA